MKSILFLIETISRYEFRCNYLRNKKLFLNLLLRFCNLCKFLNVMKKKMTLIAFVFSKLRTAKTCLDKCIKSLIWENPSANNMVNVPKHLWNLHYRTFMIFIDHCQVNWVGKGLSLWHGNSWNCLLTQLLPMKSIYFFIGTIEGYQFRYHYLRNKKLFLRFLLHFWNLD